AACKARRCGDPGHDRRHRDDACPRDVLARLHHLQHDHEPDDPGGAGRVLRERRCAPRAGGCFVVEVGLPELRRLPPGESIRPFSFESPTRFGLDEYDVANQGLVSHHYDVHDGTIASRSIPFRYVWPAELDLMARIAGMHPRERWSGWRREPFTSESGKLVAVWEMQG